MYKHLKRDKFTPEKYVNERISRVLFDGGHWPIGHWLS